MKTTELIQRGPGSVLVTLPEQLAARRIEQALRTRAPVYLALKATGAECTLTGCFHACDREAVSIAVVEGEISERLHSAYCDVTFNVRGEEHMFTSVVLQVRGGASPSLELTYPTSVQTCQRRRFVRAVVAESSAVVITQADDGERRIGEGRVLNLSPDGIACRVPVLVADACDIGGRVGLTFAIQTHAKTHHIEASIVSKVAGGTVGTIIVGFQFADSPEARGTRDRIAEDLRAFT